MEYGNGIRTKAGDISTLLGDRRALDAEREKTALLQRHLDDVRLMLPAPEAAKPRRWWRW